MKRKLQSDAQLKSLKKLNLKGITMRLFFAKNRPNDDQITTALFKVSPKEKLEKKMKSIVSSRIAVASKLEEYDPDSADIDGGFLVADENAINWKSIECKILNKKYKDLSSFEDLKNSNILIAEFLVSENEELFCIQNLPSRITQKKLNMEGILWSNKELELLDDRSKVINLNLKVDFFIWKGFAFIVNKKEFERALNLREGMKRKSEALFEKMDKSKKFDGIDALKEHVGNNMNLMGRATKAFNSGNLDDQEFLKKLFLLINEHPKWGIKINKGRIIIEKENAEAMLFLLNDARAETLVKKNLVDVRSGRLVQSSSN